MKAGMAPLSRRREHGGAGPNLASNLAPISPLFNDAPGKADAANDIALYKAGWATM